MQAGDQKTKRNENRPWGMFVLAAVIGVICGVGMLELTRRVATSAPRVGDIIAFTMEKPGVQAIEARLTADRPGQSVCILDVAAMRQSGGSLIVEEQRPGRNALLRVHWSGLRTTSDDRNCGADTDLVLRASDIQVLALGAGGYGLPGQRQGNVAWADPSIAVP